jgi:hypothetical protein
LSWGYSLDFLHSLEHYKSFRKAPGGDVFHSVPFTGLVPVVVDSRVAISSDC